MGSSLFFVEAREVVEAEEAGGSDQQNLRKSRAFSGKNKATRPIVRERLRVGLLVMNALALLGWAGL